MSVRSEAHLSRVVVNVFVCLLVLALLPATAAAQGQPTPRVEVFGGYAFYHPGLDVPTGPGQSVSLDNMPAGWGASVTFNLVPHFGLTADFGGHYKTFDDIQVPLSLTTTQPLNLHIGTIMFGPRLEARTERLTPFAEALFGLHRVSPRDLPGVDADNAFGLAIGGGLDVHVSRHLDLRLAQVDYVRSEHTFDFSQFGVAPFDATFNGVRFRTGLVLLLAVPPEGPPPSATLSLQPTEVFAGEPITATAAPHDFNPKRKLSYEWASTGGKITAQDGTATIDTTGLSPGTYTATVRVSDGKKGLASANATLTVKERPKNPPQISCSANPATVQAGTPSTITCECSSPDNAPDYKVETNITNWTATGGQVSGTGNTATLDTTGAAAGPITVTATCTDSRGLTSDGTATVNVEVPPPPPQASKLNEITFKRNSPRVDNTAKAILDDVALRLQRDADAKAVVIGFNDPNERGGTRLAARRATNTKQYLTVEKGIDPSRIETRTGTAGGMKTEIWIVPAGATFDEPGTEVITPQQTR